MLHARADRVSEGAHRAPPRPRLVLRPVSDAWEQEADRLADTLIAPNRSPSPMPRPAPIAVQRRCAGCKPEEEEERGTSILQREAESAVDAESAVPEATAARIRGLGGGQPLDPTDRRDFESRLAFDFSRVRIHADATAAGAARALRAHAFTVGHNIVFASGRYAPERLSGRRLLAHELAHVAQQTAAGSSSQPVVQRAPDGVPFEKYSDEMERQYRLRGDTITANAIRRCRDEGVPACDQILTAREWSALYSAGSSAKGDGAKLRTALSLSGPMPLLGRVGVAVSSASTTATATTAATVGGGGAGLGVGATVVAPAAAIAGVLLVAGFQLWALGRFQAALRDKGFILLDEPLGLCIGGCHMAPRPQPSLFPLRPRLDTDLEPITDWIKKRDTKEETKRRPRPPFTLRVPREKAHQLRAYQALLGVLVSDPSYVRPATRQVANWEKAIRPGGSHGMWPSVYLKAVNLGLRPPRVFRPDWSRTRSIPFEVDHIIEMQVVPRVLWPAFDDMTNYELLDQTANSAAGPRMAATIAAERAVQEAVDPTKVGRVLPFEAVALGGGSQGEVWTKDQIQRGDHIDEYERRL